MSPSPGSTLREALRQGTESRHRSLEGLPFFRNLAEGTVDARAWAGYLEALRIVYGALAEVLPPGTPPLPLAALDRDLETADRRIPASGTGEAGGAPVYAGRAPVARVRAQLLAHRLRVLADHDPAALPGAAWVLEGAALGATVLRREAEAAGRERAWLSALSARGRKGWRHQLELLESGGSDLGARERMIEAARGVFDDFASVVRALDPVLDGLERDMVHELNPHAGMHRVPRSEAVLEAALRAGERSWRRWPYYAERFGERGRAFTRSDSAWLTTLASLPRPRALEQVVWLADLLASRGMPRLLMEEHLAHLHEALSGVTLPPEEARPGDPWEVLLEAAELLAARRTSVVSARSAEGVARRFDARVPATLRDRLPRTGLLLAAALADEADGIRSAVPSLVRWLGDPGRFPKPWVDEVNRTVRAGRKRLGTARRQGG
jgi:heme oxygenase